LSCLLWRHFVWQASYILDNCFLHMFDVPFSHGVTVILLFQKWISIWYIYQRHLSMIINIESTYTVYYTGKLHLWPKYFYNPNSTRTRWFATFHAMIFKFKDFPKQTKWR
jgi:hypothetical protein